MAFTVLKSVGDYYLYDREMDSMVLISQDEATALMKGMVADASLSSLKNKGFCLPDQIQKIENSSTVTLQDNLDHNMSYMILQVTQACNLRCEYCAYSGNYYNRVHSSLYMTFDIAQKAVDFLFAHSYNQKELGIGFYGGEPLLNFSLIKKVIDYIEEYYPERIVKYNMTTNATLLTDSIVDFLVEKNFDLLFSLDGPKEIHNLHRKFSDGTGSYDKIIDNLQRFQNRHPHAFSKCRTNTVVSPEHDVACTIDYFESNPLISELTSQFSYLSEFGIKDEVKYQKYVDLYRDKEIFKEFMKMIGLTKTGSDSTLARMHMESLISSFSRMLFSGNIKGSAHPGGPCLVGQRRVFVSVNGDFFPCEKISEVDDARIGDIYNGFNNEKAEYMINIGKITEKECLKCWAFAMCTNCIAASFKTDKPDAKTRLKRCAGIKGNAIEDLADIAFLQKVGFDFQEAILGREV